MSGVQKPKPWVHVGSGPARFLTTNPQNRYVPGKKKRKGLNLKMKKKGGNSDTNQQFLRFQPSSVKGVYGYSHRTRFIGHSIAHSNQGQVVFLISLGTPTWCITFSVSWTTKLRRLSLGKRRANSQWILQTKYLLLKSSSSSLFMFKNNSFGRVRRVMIIITTIIIIHLHGDVALTAGVVSRSLRMWNISATILKNDLLEHMGYGSSDTHVIRLLAIHFVFL